ncbi:deoxyribodipyrimidine photo-lyase [Aliidiomarina iranensis]|uniref:Deoxyribodipyrimidine photo-lyase n=1 Tax=Aliidiomarina iranensis TaxID=1434071 RepID=A0A432VZY6_9GAMM|nr:deoxyribodipyrimidine photo-lyase [Aliidiomarina iranensis]RUO22302.1 deoxyribodipyrimidine photo-lyase [Aliidiomarina iranensis]
MARLVWFRQDLRLLDNDAVLQACQHANEERDKVFFIAMPTLQQYAQHNWSPLKWDLYQRQLNSLGADLAELGHSLEIIKLDWFADCENAIAEFCRTNDITDIYFNREYVFDEIKRDERVTQKLEHNLNIKVHSFDSNLLVPPECIKNGKGEYYKVFTPFFRVWRKYIREHGVAAPYNRASVKSSGVANFSAVNFSLPTISSDIPEADIPILNDSEAWPIGEALIRRNAQRFVREQVQDYKARRDTPAVEGTSKLSAYFEIGALSPRVAAHLLQKASPEFPEGLDDGAHTWLSELAWREFYQHLLFHEPRLAKGEPFQAEQAAFPWRNDRDEFLAWCEGCTGFPIVDAGMRQLNETGWMHNRVRMIVASFLVKDLHINWQWGETYFMQRLIDGSFPANNGGWQWSAGTGTDAAPYFRVFNPTSQGEKFDPDGHYIRKWVAELKDVPNKYIHNPHAYLREQTKQAGMFADDVKSERLYPKPIVDHKKARESFIQTFKQVKNNNERD